MKSPSDEVLRLFQIATNAMSDPTSLDALRNRVLTVIADSTSSALVARQDSPVSDRIRDLESIVRFLTQAIEGYCDKPGCNIPARTAALAKLRWAVEEANQKVF